MDSAALNQPPKTKRDPEKNKVNQKQYRARLKASVDGMEWVRAQNRRRYYERMAKLKADGEYEAFKAKKSRRECAGIMPSQKKNAARFAARTAS